MARGKKQTIRSRASVSLYFAGSVGTAKSTGYDLCNVVPPSNGHCPLSPVGAHHWLIDTPVGHQVSAGVCKYCGTQRDFLNWIGEGFKR